MFKLFTGYMLIFLVSSYMSIMFEGGAGPVSTQLDGAIDNETGSLVVDNVSGFVDPSGNFRQALYIESEIVTYTDIETAISGSCPVPPCFSTVVRGQFGTEAQDHSDNAIVYNEAAGAVNSLAIFSIASQLENVGAISGIFNVTTAFIKSVPTILSWDYAYLEDTNGIIKLFLLTFSVGFVAALIAMLIRLAQSIF